MTFETDEQRDDFNRAQIRIMADLQRMQSGDHREVGRQLADVANALNILQLIWNEVRDAQ